MEEKLAFLCVTWILDFWKIYLHGRNLLNAFEMKVPHPEMTLLRTHVDGRMHFYDVRRLFGFINSMDILLVLARCYGRIGRVVWQLCATIWKEKLEEIDEEFPFMHVIHYLIAESWFKVACSVVSWKVAWALRGIRVPRRDAVVWDMVEWVLLDAWCVSVLGIAEGKKLDPEAWFVAAMVVTFAGSLVSVGWLGVDDVRSHSKIGNDDESLQYKAAARQLGFHPANMLFVERDCFDVKYYDLKIIDWFWSSEGFLFIDPKVTVLPRETVNILITQELGHWHYRRSCVELAFPFLRAAALTIFLISTYDNEFVNRLFSFPEDDPPDAIVPMLVAYQWVWPYVSDFLNFLQSWFRWRRVFATDEFACRHGRPIDLINALHVVAGTSENYPVFDSWYSAWMLGSPTVQSRVAHIRRYVAEESLQKIYRRG